MVFPKTKRVFLSDVNESSERAFNGGVGTRGEDSKDFMTRN